MFKLMSYSFKCFAHSEQQYDIWYYLLKHGVEMALLAAIARHQLLTTVFVCLDVDVR